MGIFSFKEQGLRAEGLQVGIQGCSVFGIERFSASGLNLCTGVNGLRAYQCLKRQPKRVRAEARTPKLLAQPEAIDPETKMPKPSKFLPTTSRCLTSFRTHGTLSTSPALSVLVQGFRIQGTRFGEGSGV